MSHHKVTLRGMDLQTLDVAGAARFLLDSCQVSEPSVPVTEMAAAWSAPVIKGLRSRYNGGHIEIDVRKSVVRQRFDIAHELGHIVAQHTGLNPRCERTASAIAAATLMPDAAFKRDLDAWCWDLEALAAHYVVSLDMAIRRAVDLRGAVVSEWSKGKLVRRWRSPWLQGRGFSRRRVPAWERLLATDEARCCDQVRTVRDGARVWVVSEVEAWELRGCTQSKRRSLLAP